MQYFPNNTVANFRVKLAETIELTGEWEVALAEFNYPHSWSVIRKHVQQTFIYNNGSGNDDTAVLKETHYNAITDLVKALNSAIPKIVKENIQFKYNKSSRNVTVNVKNGASVWFTGDIATALGFDQDSFLQKKTTGPYVADVSNALRAMYVYTSIIEDQFVGDVKVPLLRLVNTQGDYGENVNVSFRNLQYIPLKVKSFESIEIDIKDDKNENVSFEYGKSTVTLHFRQRRSQYFI